MQIYYPDGDGGRILITTGEGASSLPTMSESVKGGAKVGKNLYMTDETLNASLPTASNLVKGCAKIGYGLAMMKDETLVVTLSGADKNTFEEYGKVVTVPTTTETLPSLTSAIEELEDWAVINTATYDNDENTEAEGWIGDVVVVLPKAFARRNYTITHIHNEDDYSEIFNKDSYVYAEDEAKGYGIEQLGESTRYAIKVPAISIHWQEEIPTNLVIHGGYDSKLCPYFPCFVPGEGVSLENNILNVTVQPYDLPTMNETLKGGAKVGANLYMTNDTLNASIPAYDLPTASASVKGGVKIGANLYMTGDTLNASVGGGLDSIPTMSATVKGGAKLGNSLIVTADEKLHVALGTTPLTIEGSMWIHDPSL